MTKKGQTPLEYLLIAIVGIVIVVSVMIFMNTSTSTTGGEVANKTNEYICRSTSCYDETQCENLEACQLSGYVNCSGQVYTESGIIPGHCSSMNSPPVCTPASLPLINCSDFNSAYNNSASGPITCLGGGYKFDISQCCATGAFTRAIDKADFALLMGRTASEDVLTTPDGIGDLCAINPDECLGMAVTMTSGPLSGNSYTLTDFGRSGGAPMVRGPIFGTNFVPPTGAWAGVALAPNWDYKVCGQGGLAPPRFVPTCGNGIVEPKVGELCDSANLNGKDCTNYIAGSQYIGGTLACNPPGPGECTWNTSGCYYYEGTVFGTFWQGSFLVPFGNLSINTPYQYDIFCVNPIDGGVSIAGRKMVFMDLSGNYSIIASGLGNSCITAFGANYESIFVPGINFCRVNVPVTNRPPGGVMALPLMGVCTPTPYDGKTVRVYDV